MESFEFENWLQFRAWVEDYSKRHIVRPTYWHGQKDPIWPLASRFERIILEGFGGQQIPGLPRPSMIYPYGGRYERDGKKIWADGFYQAMRDRYLWAFKRAAAAFGGQTPPISNSTSGGRSDAISASSRRCFTGQSHPTLQPSSPSRNFSPRCKAPLGAASPFLALRSPSMCCFITRSWKAMGLGWLNPR